MKKKSKVINICYEKRDKQVSQMTNHLFFIKRLHFILIGKNEMNTFLSKFEQ